MEVFLLQNDRNIPFLLGFLEGAELECVSSCSRDLSTSLLRDVYFQRMVVVVPVASHRNRDAVWTRVQQLSVLTRHVSTSDPKHLTLLARLPLLRTLRVGKSNVDQNSEDWASQDAIRFSYEDTLALWRLGRVVRLEMDSWVDNPALLLQDLTHLRELDLVFGYQNNHLNVIMHSRNLRSLKVAGDNLDDISALAALVQLEWLAISAWGIHDFSVLNRLTRLETLDLHHCSIVDISSLSSLVRLRDLRLDDTRVVDLRPLAGLSSLHQLSLERCPVNDLTPLIALASTLKHLNVSGCSLTFVRPLHTLHQLETLRMDHTAWSLSDTEPDVSSTLRELRQLRYVDGRVIALVTPRGSRTCLEMRSLQQMSNLERLELTGDALPNDPPLAIVIPSLVRLRVEWNYQQMANIPMAAVAHPRLRSLQLERVRLQQLSHLEFTPELRDLQLLDVVVDDISSLCLASQLTEFTLTCAVVSHHDHEFPSAPPPVHDLQPLISLPGLRYLDLSSTSIGNLQPVQHLYQLRYIDLSSTDVTDVTPLRNLRFLQTIKLRDTEITRLDPGPFCNMLRELVLPEHINCRAIREHAPLLRKLLHPDRNCLWSSHEAEA